MSMKKLKGKGIAYYEKQLFKNIELVWVIGTWKISLFPEIQIHFTKFSLGLHLNFMIFNLTIYYWKKQP